MTGTLLILCERLCASSFTNTPRGSFLNFFYLFVFVFFIFWPFSGFIDRIAEECDKKQGKRGGEPRHMGRARYQLS